MIGPADQLNLLPPTVHLKKRNGRISLPRRPIRRLTVLLIRSRDARTDRRAGTPGGLSLCPISTPLPGAALYASTAPSSILHPHRIQAPVAAFLPLRRAHRPPCKRGGCRCPGPG